MFSLFASGLRTGTITGQCLPLNAHINGQKRFARRLVSADSSQEFESLRMVWPEDEKPKDRNYQLGFFGPDTLTANLHFRLGITSVRFRLENGQARIQKLERGYRIYLNAAFESRGARLQIEGVASCPL
jgi:hypothetical protein